MRVYLRGVLVVNRAYVDIAGLAMFNHPIRQVGTYAMFY